MNIGIFDAFGVPIDLSNLVTLQLMLQPSQYSSCVTWLKVIGTDAITPLITTNGWSQGTQWNAQFKLTPADTDVGLGGLPSASYWISLIGQTTDGDIIVYSAGNVTFMSSGMLPPPPSQGVVDAVSASNSSGNTTISPDAMVFTEEITFTGSATPRNIILASTGQPKGSRVDVLALLDSCPAGVVINVYAVSTSGALLFTFTTDGFQPNALFRIVVNASANYDPVEMVVPAFL
jgi:hypothetical protein